MLTSSFPWSVLQIFLAAWEVAPYLNITSGVYFLSPLHLFWESSGSYGFFNGKLLSVQVL
jgi:hypothetical protein